MRTRWQKKTWGMVLGLVLALMAGRVALAEDNPTGQGSSSEPNFEDVGQPGAPTPAEPAAAPTGVEPAGATPFESETPPMAEPAPSVTPVPAGQQQFRLHKVGKDENLHILAAYYYGDARQWTKIYDLNKKKIRNPNTLEVGQMLKIDVPPGWQPRFNLPEFMDKERKRVANQGIPQAAKPKIIHETQQIQVIPRLLPEEGEGTAPEEKPKGEEGTRNIPSTGETPGVNVPTQAPASPLTPEEGGGQK